jgi:hypothetical protein
VKASRDSATSATRRGVLAALLCWSCGTGAPSRRSPKFLLALAATTAFATLAPGLGSPTVAAAAETCPNEQLRAENNSTALPNCRAYEQVSSPRGGEVDAPFGLLSPEIENTFTNRPFRAAADGDAVAYVGDPSPGEPGNGSTGSTSGNQYLATRSAAGWHAADVAVPGAISLETQYQAFNSDLSLGIVIGQKKERLLAPNAVPSCRNLYSRSSSSGEYQPLFTETQTPGFCGLEREPAFMGASADSSQLFFETAASLTPASEEAPGEGRENLYDSVGGHLTLVNVLPGAAPAPDPNATFGAPSFEAFELGGEFEGLRPNLSHAISADGSRVYWTDRATGIVYLRLNPAQEQSTVGGGGACTEAAKACTVAVSTGEARFWDATPDGRYAYYTENGELWRFDAQADTREALVGPGFEVKGVIGVNETGPAGSYLYFVAAGALPGTGAEALNCEEASSGPEREEEAKGLLPTGRGCNLYLLHSGEPTKLIATLAPRDDNLPINVTLNAYGGDWRPDLGRRTAELTPDGRHLLFQSTQPLTGYDNQFSNDPRHLPEAFAYNAEAEGLSCASCDPNGVPPAIGPAASVPQLPYPVSENSTYQPRWINATGTEVFFETQEPLLPTDSNGKEDVYEWQADGAGTCQDLAGCLYLLSAAAPSNAYLVDASASGSGVFFASSAQLSPSDRDQKTDLYDARENGGFPAPAAPPICLGEACKGTGTEPGATRSPGTSTFSGPGNQKPKHHKKHHRKRHHKKSHKRHANPNRRASR